MEQIKRAQAALVEGKLCQEFVPIPEQLKESTASFSDEYKDQNEKNIKDTGYASWYDFCVNEWGTKWDVEAYSNEITENGHKLECSFDSAWSPPVAFFEKMKGLGFVVEANYYEPGCAFVGEWLDGDDFVYEIPGTSDEVKEQIPEHLDEYWAISENMAEWEAEQENEEE